ncbi:hypothetical protein Tco_0242364 [Tanacetum coccineum]
MNDHECSPFTNWRNNIRETYANTNIDANYNPYQDVSRTFSNHEERKPNDDDDIGNLDYGLVQDNASYHTNEEEERYKGDSTMIGQEPKKMRVTLPRNLLYHGRRMVHLKTSRAQNDQDTSVYALRKTS